MNPVSRGIRNAFRNGVRTISIVIILGLSIGLSLTMLVANKAVGNKIASVKSSIGNTVSISPAGFSPGSEANNALTTDELNKVKSLAHVSALAETLTDRLSTTGSDTSSMPPGKASGSGSTTSLTSSIKLNSDGNGGLSGGGHFFISGGGSLPANFSLPVSFLGTNDSSHVNNSAVTIKSGKTINGSKDTNDALVSTDMASKNNLKVGSTFTAYDTAMTVAGIFDSGTQGGNDTVVLSLPALQRLSGQSGTVTNAVATVDSLDNLSSATSAIKNTLGSNADVVSAQDQADDTVKPLNSVKTVSLFSLIGSVVAGAVIILLVMIMVVRERKREIGVVKAIGGSNLRIMGEFMVEALTLTVAGAVIGLIIGFTAGQPVTNKLVDSSASSNNASQIPGGKLSRAGSGPVTAGGGPGGFTKSFRNNGAVKGLSNVKAQIGWGILLDGLGAAVFIAVLGSALASGMIAKVRPSEVLRSE